jgi:hypothetical protein
VLLDAHVAGWPLFGTRATLGSQRMSAGTRHQKERSDRGSLTSRYLSFLTVEEVLNPLLKGWQSRGHGTPPAIRHPIIEDGLNGCQIKKRYSQQCRHMPPSVSACQTHRIDCNSGESRRTLLRFV